MSEAKKLARLSQWRRLVDAQKRSGMSVRSWCAQNALTEQQYYYRLRHVREAVLESIVPDSDVQLVRLPDIGCQVVTRDQDSDRTVIVRHGATSVEFSPDCDILQIASFVRALEL